jgi:hypothetical protein
MKRFKQNPVRFDEKELKTDLGSGNFIFVGSSCDMFAGLIPYEWIVKTVKHCNQYDNSYFFQSKDPAWFYIVTLYCFKDYSLCTTIETNRQYPEIMGDAPYPINRAIAFNKIPIEQKYITIEPIMDFDLSELVEMIKMCEPRQVNIGADSCGHKLPEPTPDKILQLIDELSKFTIVHQKSNLKRLLK